MNRYKVTSSKGAVGASAEFKYLWFALKAVKIALKHCHEVKIELLPQNKKGDICVKNAANTIKRWKIMFDNGWKFICGIYKLPITHKDQLSIDHIHPKSLGGKNHRNNYQLAHVKCNSRRGRKPLERAVTSLKQQTCKPYDWRRR